MRKLSSFVCPKNNLSLTGTYYCQRSSPSSFTEEYNLPPSSLDYKSFSFETDIAYESRFYTLVTPPDASVQLTSTRSYTASPASNTCRKPDRFEFEPAISGTVIPNTLSSDDSNPSWADECIPVSTFSLEWPIPAPDVNCQAKQRPNPSLPSQP